MNIALCGNSAIEKIVNLSFAKYFPQNEPNLRTRFEQQPSRSHTPELYTTAMHERACKRAVSVLKVIPQCEIGIAFEHCAIELGVVANLVGLDILEMTPEEIQSDDTRKKIRTELAEAKRTHQKYTTVSLATVVDHDGLIFTAQMSDHYDEVRDDLVAFTYGYTTCFDAEVLEVGDRIADHESFAKAIADALLAYRKEMISLPIVSN